MQKFSPPITKRIPMDEIIPNLWLGSFKAGGDKELLEEHNIKYRLTVLKEEMSVFPGVISQQIPIDDMEAEDIAAHFATAIAFIDEALTSGNGILVHCQGGVSRSATVVAAYLMKTRRISRGDALKLIRATRKFVSPNEGFMSQLGAFHRNKFLVLEKAIFPENLPSTSSTPQHKIVCGQCRCALATREHMLHSAPLSAGDAGPGLTNSAPLESASQKVVIATIEQVHPEPESMSSDVTITQQQKQGAFETAAATPTPLSEAEFHPISPAKEAGSENAPSLPILNPTTVCSGYFMDPILLRWIDDFSHSGQSDGIILCPNPKCKVKLGNYDWAGWKCKCSKHVTPAFCILRSKVAEIL